MVPAIKIVQFSHFNRYFICTVYGIIIPTNKGRTMSFQNSYPHYYKQQTVQISYFNGCFIRTPVLTNEQSKQNRNNQGSKERCQHVEIKVCLIAHVLSSPT